MSKRRKIRAPAIKADSVEEFKKAMEMIQMQHSKDYILEELKIIAVTALEIDPIVAARASLDSSIVDDLGLTSLTIFDFIIAIENRFRIELAEKELMKVKTLGDAIDLIYTTLSDEEWIG
jgi:acyl carrier protein